MLPTRWGSVPQSPCCPKGFNTSMLTGCSYLPYKTPLGHCKLPQHQTPISSGYQMFSSLPIPLSLHLGEWDGHTALLNREPQGRQHQTHPKEAALCVCAPIFQAHHLFCR